MNEIFDAPDPVEGDQLFAILQSLKQMDDAALAQSIQVWGNQMRLAGEVFRAAQMEARMRLTTREVTEARQGDWILTLKQPPTQYVWNEEALLTKLKPLLGVEWNVYVEEKTIPARTEYKPRTSQLKALVKRRGKEFQTVYDQCYDIVPKGDPKVEVTHLQPQRGSDDAER